MSDLSIDFNEDVSTKYTSIECDHIELLIMSLLEDDKEIPSSYGWESSLTKEKHDQLNYSYHISLYREADDHEIEVTYYTGIDVGCEMVHYSLEGDSITNRPMMVSVLTDLELDLSLIDSKVNLKLAQHMLDGSKESIMEIYSKQNYDNYVTGGGTTKTINHYKDEFQKYHNRGLYWTCIYREEEVDRNIV